MVGADKYFGDCYKEKVKAHPKKWVRKFMNFKMVLAAREDVEHRKSMLPAGHPAANRPAGRSAGAKFTTLRVEPCLEHKPTGRDSSVLVSDLIVFVISELKKLALEALQEKRAPKVTAAEVHWELTVPSSWDEFAIGFMVRAARAAGLGDSVGVCRESCAAMVGGTSTAVGVKRGGRHRMVIGVNARELAQRLSPGDMVLTVDFGHGSSDFSTMLVTSTRDGLEFARLAACDAGIIMGGSDIDDAFLQDFGRFYHPKPRHGFFFSAKGRLDETAWKALVMQQWTDLKHAFEGNGGDHYWNHVPLGILENMKPPSTPGFTVDKAGRRITITHEKMMSYFEPVLDNMFHGVVQVITSTTRADLTVHSSELGMPHRAPLADEAAAVEVAEPGGDGEGGGGDGRAPRARGGAGGAGAGAAVGVHPAAADDDDGAGAGAGAGGSDDGDEAKAEAMLVAGDARVPAARAAAPPAPGVGGPPRAPGAGAAPAPAARGVAPDPDPDPDADAPAPDAGRFPFAMLLLIGGLSNSAVLRRYMAARLEGEDVPHGAVPRNIGFLPEPSGSGLAVVKGGLVLGVDRVLEEEHWGTDEGARAPEGGHDPVALRRKQPPNIGGLTSFIAPYSIGLRHVVPRDGFEARFGKPLPDLTPPRDLLRGVPHDLIPLLQKFWSGVKLSADLVPYVSVVVRKGDLVRGRVDRVKLSSLPIFEDQTSIRLQLLMMGCRIPQEGYVSTGDAHVASSTNYDFEDMEKQGGAVFDTRADRRIDAYFRLGQEGTVARVNYRSTKYPGRRDFRKEWRPVAPEVDNELGTPPLLRTIHRNDHDIVLALEYFGCVLHHSTLAEVLHAWRNDPRRLRRGHEGTLANTHMGNLLKKLAVV